MDDKRSAWLPVRKAREFAKRKGWQKEADYIEGFPKSHPLSLKQERNYRRALYMKLFQFRGVWQEFTEKYWPDASKPNGAETCEEYERLVKEVFQTYPETEALLKGQEHGELITPTGQPESIIINLTPDQKAQLDKLAKEFSIGTPELTRIWILERLRQLR